MRRCAIVLLLLLACLTATAQTRWRAGEYKGLITGKSTLSDVQRVFGNAEPKESGQYEIYSFPGKGEFGGDVFVEVSRTSGKVEQITIKFSPNLTRTTTYKHFGNNYNEVHYSTAQCGDGVNPPVYRDSKGWLELLEIPSKGLILWPNEVGFDIAAVVFRAKPLPKSKPSCK